MQLIQVSKADKEILRNLLEKYDYEFSQYDNRDVNPLGLYGYDYLDNYWSEDNRWAYFIKSSNQLSGFAMVNDYPEVVQGTSYSMAEFCILYKYRCQNLGKAAAFKLFDIYQGKWQLKYHPKNKPSAAFWNKVVGEYTDNHYEIIKNHPDAAYDDGTIGEVLVFDTRIGKYTRF